MLSMLNAGVRVFDVRNPDEPTEVAYFNPGMVRGRLDSAAGHIRFVPESHQIWFATSTGGFWVTRIEDQVLQYLGDLPADVPVDDPGAPGTMGITASLPLSLDVNTELYTCLLSNCGSAVGTIGSASQ